MLNVEIRPFTTKWHKEGLAPHRIRPDKFQEDLKQLQSDLAPYVAKFLEMASTKDEFQYQRSRLDVPQCQLIQR
jgi:hypothetical protein